jgi:hypothetical protein
MASIPHPTTRLWTPASADFGLRQAVIPSTSPLDGQTQTVEVLGARWVCSVTYTAANNNDRAQFEALFADLRAQVNRLSMGHPLRRVPRGTMRGAPTLGAAAAALAETINISGTGTLLAGDMLGVNGQLVMVAVTPTNLNSVRITPRLRGAATSGTPVVWDWPRALWIATSDVVRIPLAPVASPSLTVDLVEVFS